MPRDRHAHILVDTLRFAPAVKFYLMQLIIKANQQLQIYVSSFLVLGCVAAQCTLPVFYLLHTLNFLAVED